jgi:dTMP kinase
MHPLTNAYLYAAARAQTLETVVRPALERGDIVISDRSWLSSCTIQGEAQGLGIDRILEINMAIVSDILPDLIIYLDVDIDLALSRIFDSGGDKFEKEGREFYARITR